MGSPLCVFACLLCHLPQAYTSIKSELASGAAQVGSLYLPACSSASQQQLQLAASGQQPSIMLPAACSSQGGLRRIPSTQWFSNVLPCLLPPLLQPRWDNTMGALTPEPCLARNYTTVQFTAGKPRLLPCWSWRGWGGRMGLLLSVPQFLF
jgi:hypothetical protein